MEREPGGGRGFVEALADLVEAESPSKDVAALHACADVLAKLGARVAGAQAERAGTGDGRPALVWRRGDPDDPRRVLLLGHLDTVWPVGTVAERPFSVSGDRATGPGVFDMKAGLLVGLYALGRLDPSLPITFLVTADEEIGSPSGRVPIEAEARHAQAVLVLEGAADGGALKSARKGLSLYTLRVRGRAAHAGLEPERGSNALVRLARLVDEVTALAVPEEEVTVTPTTASAGETVNTVPDRAELTVDVRAPTLDWQLRVDTEIRALAGAGVSVGGGINRPPMEHGAAAPLLRRLAELEGGPPPAVAVGGVSDANLTAALGVPTLDGLGAVGGGAHADHEWIDLVDTARRITLVTGLIADLIHRSPRRADHE